MSGFILTCLIVLVIYVINHYKIILLSNVNVTDEEMNILISEHPVFKKICSDFTKSEFEGVSSNSRIQVGDLFGKEFRYTNINNLRETKAKLLYTLKEIRRDEKANKEIERILEKGKKKNKEKRISKELRMLKIEENDLKYADFLLANFPNSEVCMADSQIMELLMSEFNVDTDKAKIILDDLTDTDTGLLSGNHLGIPIYKYYENTGPRKIQIIYNQ